MERQVSGDSCSKKGEGGRQREKEEGTQKGSLNSVEVTEVNVEVNVAPTATGLIE